MLGNQTHIKQLMPVVKHIVTSLAKRCEQLTKSLRKRVLNCWTTTHTLWGQQNVSYIAFPFWPYFRLMPNSRVKSYTDVHFYALKLRFD